MIKGIFSGGYCIGSEGDLEVHLVSACVKHNAPDFISQFVAIILNAFLTAFLSLPPHPHPNTVKIWEIWELKIFPNSNTLSLHIVFLSKTEILL